MQTINIKYLNPKKGSRILDLGCGQGRHCFGAYIFADVDVFGFDMSHEDVIKAKENFKDFDESSSNKSCSFGVTDGRKLPFESNSFDYKKPLKVIDKKHTLLGIGFLSRDKSYINPKLVLNAK